VWRNVGTESGGLTLGKAVTWGGRATPRPAARERYGRAARRQVRRPEQVRTGNPTLQPRELAARERPTAASTRATRPAAEPGESKTWQLSGLGRNCTPQAPVVNSGSLPEPVKSASRPYGMACGHT
jgi:hypothetical protein